MLFGVLSIASRNSSPCLDPGQSTSTDQPLGCRYLNLCLLVIKDRRVKAMINFEGRETGRGKDVEVVRQLCPQQLGQRDGWVEMNHLKKCPSCWAAPSACPLV